MICPTDGSILSFKIHGVEAKIIVRIKFLWECTFQSQRGPPAVVVWLGRRLIKINCFLCRQHCLGLGAGRPEPDDRPGRRPAPLVWPFLREVRVQTPGLGQRYVTRINKQALWRLLWAKLLNLVVEIGFIKQGCWTGLFKLLLIWILN